MEERKLQAGLIGCGRIGYKFDLDDKRSGIWTHAGAFNKCDDVDFVGVYDVNDSVAEECANRYKTGKFNSISDVVNNCDLVSIAVPEDSCKNVLSVILDRMKTSSNPSVLWVEKPFIGDHSTALRFVSGFSDYNCHIHINYQRRWCQGFKLLESYGEPLGVDITYTRGLYNTASHFVDMILGLYYPRWPNIVVVNDTDFILDFSNFTVQFKMLKDIKYNICDSVFYYNSKVVHVPPLQTEFHIRDATPSSKYSEYYDLGHPRTLELPYDPMLEQLKMLKESIKYNNYNMLNKGLTTLTVLNKVRRYNG